MPVLEAGYPWRRVDGYSNVKFRRSFVNERSMERDNPARVRPGQGLKSGEHRAVPLRLATDFIWSP